MAGKRGFNSGQLLSFAQNSYLERTSRAVYAIIFLLPFIIFYELGTILINTDLLNQSQIRVVAFVWLQNFLEYLGFGSKFAWIAPPLAVVIILAAFQLASGKRWIINFGDLWLMAVECILLAVPLIITSLLLNGPARPPQNSSLFHFFEKTIPVCSAAAGINKQPLLPSIITGIGAGIYEELVFRLILICLLMLLFQDALKLSHKASIILAVLISAALFSAHHHVIFLNGRLDQSAPFNLPEFTFRTLAGVYFAALFAVRGFGITAGTHAFYDIIAVFINAQFFPQ
jgi:hypothetical protein